MSAPPRRGRRRAVLIVILLGAAELAAQTMLGHPMMAQLLAPSPSAVVAIALVIFTLLARIVLVVAVPSLAAAFVVGEILRRRWAQPAASRARRASALR